MSLILSRSEYSHVSLSLPTADSTKIACFQKAETASISLAASRAEFRSSFVNLSDLSVKIVTAPCMPHETFRGFDEFVCSTHHHCNLAR